MSATSSAARVVAALLGSSLLMAGAAGLPAYAAPSDGTIKVTPHGTAHHDTENHDTEQPANAILKGCSFDVEFDNFDNFTDGIEVVQVQLHVEGEQGGGAIGVPTTVVLEESAGSSFNGEQKFTVDPTDLPRGPQGIHLRVEVGRVDSTIPGKSKLFWLDCTAIEPVKVDAGGESGASGLIALAVAGLGVAAAAGYGLTCSPNRLRIRRGRLPDLP